MRGHLGSDLSRIDSLLNVMNDIVVDSVLHPRRAVRVAEQPKVVALILCEKQLWRPFAVEIAPTQDMMVSLNGREERCCHFVKFRFCFLAIPAPGIPEPERRQ